MESGSFQTHVSFVNNGEVVVVDSQYILKISVVVLRNNFHESAIFWWVSQIDGNQLMLRSIKVSVEVKLGAIIRNAYKQKVRRTLWVRRNQRMILTSRILPQTCLWLCPTWDSDLSLHYEGLRPKVGFSGRESCHEAALITTLKLTREVSFEMDTKRYRPSTSLTSAAHIHSGLLGSFNTRISSAIRSISGIRPPVICKRWANTVMCRCGGNITSHFCRFQSQFQPYLHPLIHEIPYQRNALDMVRSRDYLWYRHTLTW